MPVFKVQKNIEGRVVDVAEFDSYKEAAAYKSKNMLGEVILKRAQSLEALAETDPYIMIFALQKKLKDLEPQEVTPSDEAPTERSSGEKALPARWPNGKPRKALAPKF